MRSRTVAPALTALLLPLVLPLTAVGPVSAHPAQAGPRAVASDGAPAVTGFALGGVGRRVLDASAGALSTVTVDGVSLRADGAAVPAPSRDVVSTLHAAHARGLDAQLLVSNFSDTAGDFSAAVAHRMLADDDHRAAVAASLARDVRRQGWDGVNVDLELVPRGDADELVAFLGDLRAALPDDAVVSVDVSAATSARGYRTGGYDLAGLGRAADVVQLMAYDQHGPGWSGPGPIGDLRWQRRALTVLLHDVPAERVDLGVAGYGYTWPTADGGAAGRTVSDRGARARVARDDVHARWHPDAGEWSARLADGDAMWWSDARSYGLRRRLAARLHLHGLALWRLGAADPLR